MTLLKRLDVLQQKINYRFCNKELLQQSLTHSSMQSHPSNERLEFLGDRILGMVISEYLYHNKQDAEGGLARQLNQLVARSSCAIIAKKIDLGSCLFLSTAEAQTGGRDKDNLLGNACEALIAAIYLDSNFCQAKQVILNLWQPLLNDVRNAADSKSALQQWTQARKLGLPIYELTNKTGKDHAPIFEISVSVTGYQSVIGVAGSRRLAEQEAARLWLEQFADE